MKRQIKQILHNLIGKGMTPDGMTDGNKTDQEMFHAVDSVRTGDNKQNEAAVQVVDRQGIERIVNKSLGEAQERGCLLVCDVDRCREINDIYGHDTGDAVLQNVADVLFSVFRCDAHIGSLGSDMYVLWMGKISRDSADDIRLQVGVVNDRLLHPVGELPPVSVSVGAAFCKEDDDYRSLGKRANKALYLVKESGRCGCEMSL